MKSRRRSTVLAGMPGPLSRIVMRVLLDRNGDVRRDSGLLGGIEGVVEKLLEDDQRPVVDVVSGLRDQLLDRREVEEPRGREGGALQLFLLGGACGHLAPPFMSSIASGPSGASGRARTTAAVLRRGAVGVYFGGIELLGRRR